MLMKDLIIESDYRRLSDKSRDLISDKIDIEKILKDIFILSKKIMMKSDKSEEMDDNASNIKDVMKTKKSFSDLKNMIEDLNVKMDKLILFLNRMNNISKIILRDTDDYIVGLNSWIAKNKK